MQSFLSKFGSATSSGKPESNMDSGEKNALSLQLRAHSMRGAGYLNQRNRQRNPGTAGYYGGRSGRAGQMLSGGRNGANTKEALFEPLHRGRLGTAAGASQENFPCSTIPSQNERALRSEREHDLNALSKGSHGKTMSSDEFSLNIEKSFIDNIYQSQKKLMKNQYRNLLFFVRIWKTNPAISRDCVGLAGSQFVEP